MTDHSILRSVRELPPPETGVLTISKSPWEPFEDCQTERIESVQTIEQAFELRSIAPNGASPWVICIDGEWISRREWSERCISPANHVLMLALPQGGGKTSRIVAGIVMIVVGFILSVVSWGYMASVGTYMMQMGAAMLVGGVLYRAPNVYTPDSYASLANPSPTYNLQAQGNYARVGQPIPRIYGRVPHTYPDFAAQPYGEYSGNDQYLYQLFCLGWGSYEIERLYIEDQELVGELKSNGYFEATGAWNDITWEIIEPGGAVTLFPTRVITSEIVSGQEITNAGVGPFALTDEEVNALAFDVVAPAGMYYANDEGGLDSRAANFDIYIQRLKQDANSAAWVPDGNEFKLASESIVAATNTPQRRSFRYTVELGRYRARVIRTNGGDTSTRAADEIDWYGLRGYVPGDQRYGNVTLLAMRMRATDQLSSASSRKINFTGTAKVRTWSPSAGWSVEPVATRSIAWAFADVLVNDEYGIGFTDDRIPLTALYALDAEWAVDGYYCDYVFDRQSTAKEALTLIARTGDAQWFSQRGQARIVRSKPAGIPRQFYNMRNIVRGSLAMEWTLPTSSAPDCYDIWYRDNDTATSEQVRCALPGGTQLRPARVDLAGVGDRLQAWKIGMQMLRSQRWHRISGSHKSELEGQIATPGNTVAIVHDFLLPSVSAELVAYTGTGKDGSNVLTLSDEVVFDGAGPWYVELSTRTGGYSGPWRVTQGATTREVILDEMIADDAYTPYAGGAAERTRVAFGPAESISVKAILVAPIEVNGDQCTLHWVVDNPRAYDDSGATAPDITPGFDLTNLTRPRLEGLLVVWSGTLTSPSLDVSWLAATGATRYLVEISDNGQSWSRLPDVSSTSVRIACKLQPQWLRVAAVGALRGDWVQWSGNPATMQSIPADVTGLVLANAAQGVATEFADTSAVFSWNPAARADVYTCEIWIGGDKVSSHARAEARFEYSAELNRIDGGLHRVFELRVRGANGSGESEHAAVLNVSNPQMPATIVQGQQTSDMAVLLTVPISTASDYAGTRFVVSKIAATNPASAAASADVKNFGATVPVSSAGTWYFWAANYDQFGADGLNWSPRGQITVIESAKGVSVVPDASAITAPPGSDAPGGDAYWAVYDAATEKMWMWNSALGKYTTSVSAEDIDGQIAQAQISADVRWTANQLLVQANNAVPDPDFEAWAAGTTWSRSAGWWIAVDDGYYATFGAKRVIGSSGSAAAGVIQSAWSNPVALPFKPGESVRLSAFVRNDANQQVFVALQCLPGLGLDSGLSWDTIFWNPGEQLPKSSIFTIPAGAKYFRVYCANAAPAGVALTGAWALGVPNLCLAAGASLIVDGAVVARHLAAEAVTTPKLQAGAVTADKVSVASLSALSANLGNITTGSIEFTSGSGWKYVRTPSKWFSDGVNGWVTAGRPENGSFFQDFRASVGSALFEERKAGGPDFGTAHYYLHVRDASGVERVLIDPQGGSFLLKGRIEADEGYFSGSLNAATGSFSGNLTAQAVSAISRINIGDEQITMARAVEGTALTFSPGSMYAGESINCVITAGFSIRGVSLAVSTYTPGGEAGNGTTINSVSSGGVRGTARIYIDGVAIKEKTYFVLGSSLLTMTLAVSASIQKGAVVSIGFEGIAFTQSGFKSSGLNVAASSSYLEEGWIVVQGIAK